MNSRSALLRSRVLVVSCFFLLLFTNASADVFSRSEFRTNGSSVALHAASPHGKYLLISRGDESEYGLLEVASDTFTSLTKPGQNEAFFPDDIGGMYRYQGSNDGTQSNVQTGIDGCKPASVAYIAGDGSVRTLLASTATEQFLVKVDNDSALVLTLPSSEVEGARGTKVCTPILGTMVLYRLYADGRILQLWHGDGLAAPSGSSIVALGDGIAALAYRLVLRSKLTTIVARNDLTTQEVPFDFDEVFDSKGSGYLAGRKGTKIVRYEVATGSITKTSYPGVSIFNPFTRGDRVYGSFAPFLENLTSDAHPFIVDREGEFRDLTCEFPQKNSINLGAPEAVLDDGSILLKSVKSGFLQKFSRTDGEPVDYCPRLKVDIGTCRKFFSELSKLRVDDTPLYHFRTKRLLPASSKAVSCAVKFALSDPNGMPLSNVSVRASGAIPTTIKKTNSAGTARFDISTKALCKKTRVAFVTSPGSKTTHSLTATLENSLGCGR